MLEREELSQSKQGDKRESRQTLTMLSQAALRMDAVTGDAAWDQYASYVEQALVVAQRESASIKGRLESPQLVNADQIAMLRNHLLMTNERIRVLEWVITMPAEIKKVGTIAKEKLAQMIPEAEEGSNVAAA